MPIQIEPYDCSPAPPDGSSDSHPTGDTFHTAEKIGAFTTILPKVAPNSMAREPAITRKKPLRLQSTPASPPGPLLAEKIASTASYAAGVAQ